LQRLFAYVSQRLHRQPSKLCLEHLDAPMGLDFLAYLEAERGNRPRTRNTRLAAMTSFMRFVE
jgi:integrase/recombinase XerD